MTDREITVVGAGLAGLSAAITLQNAGRAVRVVEASDRPGGRVSTDLIDGFTLDRGFQLINAHYPEIKRLDVISSLNFTEAPRAVDVSMEDRRFTVGDPRQYLASSLSAAAGTIKEKFNLLRYLVTPSDATKSVEEELKHLGNLYQRVLSPFLTGVFLTSPSRINAINGKEIIRSFISGKPGLPADGVGVLPKLLASKINKIEYGRRVDSLREFGRGPVIVATDVTTAAQLLDMTSVPQLAASTTWYHEVPKDLSASQRLLIDGQRRGPVVNSILISHLVPTYAPKGKALLSSTTIEFASESEVRRHLSLMWGAQSSEWSLIAKYEIPKSLPIFAPGHREITSSKISDGVFVAGDYRAAPSQNGALLSGRLAAQSLLFDQRS